MGDSAFTSIRSDEWEMREIFNKGKFPEGVSSGELRCEIKRSKEVFDETLTNWIPGTLSQELRYYDQNNNLIAKTHRYLRPDGKLAASGLEDPKRVVEGTVMHILRLPSEPKTFERGKS
jgi:hypothetical protein